MLGKSTHLQVIALQSSQKAGNLRLQTCEENQWTFLLYDSGVNFSLRSNFANLGSFATVSVPVLSLIP